MRAIYKITGKSNKSYIGKSNNVFIRLNQHFQHLKSKTHHSKKLQTDYDNYGYNYFTFEVLEAASASDISEKEIFYIKKFNSLEKGYNEKDEGKFLKIISDNEKKEQFIKKAFIRIAGNDHNPVIKYIDQETIDLILPIMDNNIDLMRSNNEIIVIPDKYKQFRKIPFIFLDSDLQ